MNKKFAFLVHPRNNPKYDMSQLFWSPLGLIPNRVWSAAFQHLPIPPMITGRMAYADNPDEIVGTIITVPLTPHQLINGPRTRVQAKLNAAVDLAIDQGATVVGLGALTAPAAGGGKTLSKRTDVSITNGNAFTAAITLMGVEKLLDRMGPAALVAFVGATGSVGTCLVRLFSRKRSGRVLLVARNQTRLERLAKEICCDHLDVSTSTDMTSVRDADLIVLLTSSTEALLRSEHLKKGAVVLDDTVPRNTSLDIVKLRPDVTIVDGGLVEIPGARLTGPIGLPSGLAYACLAETMLLALDGHDGHFSIGTPHIDQAEYMMQAAVRHRTIGFQLAPFRSFGKVIKIPRDDAALLACAV
ncbi:semialdehyde dehydrogenase [Aureimonas pseudogalii]|uniref:Putative amino acid dehydrogenase n=1 Tax=Aureimonas pseudogalii TaxID=1744844 RepID=A0A7W6MMD5_9HYPH|nr:semialdehyde dehydrogenase [Aureimonas pseudogalii]MBB4000679.1 putative amino acid dehydrogenase [Aureimonas pseudogalii]